MNEVTINNKAFYETVCVMWICAGCFCASLIDAIFDGSIFRTAWAGAFFGSALTAIAAMYWAKRVLERALREIALEAGQ